MFYLQSFATQCFLMDDMVINCKLTCIFLPHLLLNSADQSTLLTAHHGRTICRQSHKFIPRKAHYVIHLDTSSKISFPVFVPCIDFNSKSSFVMHRLESTPRMKIDSWAVSHVSLLSSTARDYAIKSFPFLLVV